MTETPMSEPEFPKGGTGDPNTDLEASMAAAASAAAESKGALEIVVLDVSTTLGICDYFVIATATNMPMAKAITDEVERVLTENFERKPRSVEGATERRWTLMDYGDIVVHVFMSEDRDYYRIERLFADAPTLDWRSLVPTSD